MYWQYMYTHLPLISPLPNKPFSQHPALPPQLSTTKIHTMGLATHALPLTSPVPPPLPNNSLAHHDDRFQPMHKILI